MKHGPLALEPETGQDDDGATLSGRERMVGQAQRLTFLKQSALYLGRTLTAGQLRCLIGRIEQ
ncbi:hypothetical protein [Thiogranum longum]